MKISDALKQYHDLEIPFGGEVLRVTYMPSAVTIADVEALKTNKDIKQVAKQIREQVRQWDLTDDHGNLIPLAEPTSPLTITPEGEPLPASAFEDPIHNVPISILVKVLIAIQQDQRPNPEA